MMEGEGGLLSESDSRRGSGVIEHTPGHGNERSGRWKVAESFG
jgi:hypothetical protein